MGMSVAAGAYSWRVEPTWFEVVRRPLPIPGLRIDWVGKTLVQLSDLHAGPFVDDAYLHRCFRLVATWQPDLVVYTGDFVTRGWNLSNARLEQTYKEIPLGRLGTFGVVGNHEFGRNYQEGSLADRIARMMGTVGVRMLRDETVHLPGLTIHGIDDLWGTKFDMDYTRQCLAVNRPDIVLCHNPDVADLPVWGATPSWTLCGHTHGGQCRLPWLTSFVLPVQNTDYVAGEYSIADGRRMYINRGLGYLARLRFAARPEITVFRLERG